MRQQKVDKRQGIQWELVRGEGGIREDWKMEVDEEVECKKKLDEQRKRLQKIIREIDNITEMESGRETCRRLSRSGMISCQSVKRCKKRVSIIAKFAGQKKEEVSQGCACDEETEKVREKITAREAHFQEFAQRSRKFRLAADDLEEESGPCKQEKTGDAVVHPS